MASPPASADQPNPAQPSREELQPNRQAPPPVARPRALLRRAAPPCSITSYDPAQRFVLDGVEVSGAKVDNVWADFIGKSINAGDVCTIQQRIETRLYDKGVGLVRVVIPEQTFKPGERKTIRFQVIAGRISQLRIHGDIGPAQAKVEAILSHLRGMSPFNRFAAERWLLLANDVPGVQARANLTRDFQGGPADFIIDIDLHREVVDEVVQVSNYDAKTLGPYTGIARLDLNSLTPLGERTSLIAYSTLNNFSQEILQAIEEVRLGANGVTARASFTYGYSHPGDVLAPLDLHGDSYVGTVEVDDALIRRRSLDLTVASGIDFVNQRTNEPGGVALSDDALRVFWARGHTDGQIDLGGAVLGDVWRLGDSLNLEVRKGIHALGASSDGSLALSRPSGRSDAWVLRSDGLLSLSGASDGGHGLPVTLSTRFQAQWADRPLLAYEEQSIGNLTIGRGYDPSAATGDRAVAGETKVAFGPFALNREARPARRFTISPYGFYDIARVTSLEPGVGSAWLRSTGGGIEMMLPYGLHLDLFYARPLDRPYIGDIRKPPARVLFQISFVH